MADVDLTDTVALQGGNTVSVTMDANVGDVRRVLLPSWPSKITMQFQTSGGVDEVGFFEFTTSLADSDAKTAAAFKVPLGSYQRWLCPEGQTPVGGVVIYLAGSTTLGLCKIDLEP